MPIDRGVTSGTHLPRGIITRVRVGVAVAAQETDSRRNRRGDPPHGRVMGGDGTPMTSMAS
jgi:hypothetical protein